MQPFNVESFSMTERLYYTDSFLREFEACVISCVPSGNNFHIVLDRTAFFPTSGGQPNDIGRLGESAVVDVFERKDGEIFHVTESAVPAGAVRGQVDWERRFDHMQQHSGQHLLSAAFVELFNFSTVSFHLGTESSTIDLGTTELTPQQTEEAERRTNQIIFEDRAVEIQFGTREKLAAAGVRKEVDREGVLRAVCVKDFDLQPCGGTHVARTGQVGLVALRKIEKQKQNWRVEFVCGGRALRAMREDFARLGEAARLLTCGQQEVPAMLAKALEERKQAQRAQKMLLEALAAHEATEMLRAAPGGNANVRRVVMRVMDNAEPAYLRMLATRLVTEPGVQALLGTRVAGAGAGQAIGHVVFAQSAGLATDMNVLLRECMGAAGGKGGGTRDFAQGSVPDATELEALLRCARESLYE
jgi:alanyl-tRNA synthetase